MRGTLRSGEYRKSAWRFEDEPMKTRRRPDWFRKKNTAAQHEHVFADYQPAAPGYFVA
jgi:hypothetical protein